MSQETVAQAEEVLQIPPDESTGTAEQQPEPAAGEGTEQTIEAGTEPTGETQETQGEGTDDNWLPEEQAKEFPLETLAEFSQKRNYGFSKEDIAGNPGLQKVLKDKLNTDIHIRSLTQQEGGGEEVDELGEFLGEEGLELPEPDEQQVAQPLVTAQPSDPRATHYQRVDSLVGRFDSKVTEEIGRNVLSAMQINADPKYIEQLQGALRNNATPPEQRAAIQQHLDLVNNAGKLGGTLARGALDMVMTALPEVLPDLIEQVYPGSQARYQRGVVADAWEQVRGSVGKDQKPIYPNLPTLGSPEFKQMLVKAEKRMGLPHGAFDSMVFRDQQGNPLSFDKNIRAVMKLVAKNASGQSVSPAIVNQALQTGKNKAAETAQRRAQGRALGSGQQTSSAGSDDAFKKAILAHNASQRST